MARVRARQVSKLVQEPRWRYSATNSLSTSVALGLAPLGLTVAAGRLQLNICDNIYLRSVRETYGGFLLNLLYVHRKRQAPTFDL